MYFAGAISSGLFVTRSGDIYGRKLPTMISALVSIPIHIALMASTNLNFSIVMFYLFGLTRPGKMQVSFVYVSELVPEKFRRFVGTFILFFDGSSLILFGFYFLLISKNWVYFQVFTLLLSIASTAILFFIPESPKYLMNKRRYEDARNSFVKIAIINKVCSEAIKNI